jgi:hypothetical protein
MADCQSAYDDGRDDHARSNRHALCRPARGLRGLPGGCLGSIGGLQRASHVLKHRLDLLDLLLGLGKLGRTI